MTTQPQWSAVTVIFALVPILHLGLWVIVQRRPGFKIQDFADQIQNDKQFTSLPLTVPGARNLGELLGQRPPTILRALNSYAEYGSRVQLFIEASVLGLLSLIVALTNSLRHVRSPFVWLFLSLQGILLIILVFMFLFGYRQHTKRRNDPARSDIAKRYLRRAIICNAINAFLGVTQPLV